VSSLNFLRAVDSGHGLSLSTTGAPAMGFWGVFDFLFEFLVLVITGGTGCLSRRV